MPAPGSPGRLTRRDLLKGLAAAGIGVTSGAVAHGYLYERFRIGVTRETLEVSGLPSALSGLRIGLVTDFHRSDTVTHDIIDQAVQLLMREAPDLIAGRVRINQCVAAALVLGAGGALLARVFASS